MFATFDLLGWDFVPRRLYLATRRPYRPGTRHPDHPAPPLPGHQYPALSAVRSIGVISYGSVSRATVRALGGTSVLIVVGGALDTMRQMESQMMMRNYEGFLK